VRDHLGLKKTPATAPEALVTLRFEAIDADVEAKVIPAGWYPDDAPRPVGELRDVAFLSLGTAFSVEALRYLALAPWVPRGGKTALVIGAEPGYETMSQNISVKLAENPNNRGLWQLDAAPCVNFAVVRGFSGAPLMDDAGTVIWGMIVEVDAKGRPVAFAVGADRLYEARRRLESYESTNSHSIVPGATEPPPEQMLKLHEQLSQANMERDAARKELQTMIQRQGSFK